jgi:hypothetical protein
MTLHRRCGAGAQRSKPQLGLARLPRAEASDGWYAGDFVGKPPAEEPG